MAADILCYRLVGAPGGKLARHIGGHQRSNCLNNVSNAQAQIMLHEAARGDTATYAGRRVGRCSVFLKSAEPRVHG